jgi:mannose-6-phosphate isomerase-like protein (cupin superfamily)
MKKNISELRQVINENMRGGNGSIIITHLADSEDMYDKSRLFAKLTIKPECSIGYHIHEKETEIFNIISGTALYDDNGTEIELFPGDVTITPAGHGHSIANNGNTDLIVIALIMLQ